MLIVGSVNFTPSMKYTMLDDYKIGFESIKPKTEPIKPNRSPKLKSNCRSPSPFDGKTWKLRVKTHRRVCFNFLRVFKNVLVKHGLHTLLKMKKKRGNQGALRNQTTLVLVSVI